MPELPLKNIVVFRSSLFKAFDDCERGNCTRSIGPVEVFPLRSEKGKYQLFDGHHRLIEYLTARKHHENGHTIPAKIVDKEWVRQTYSVAPEEDRWEYDGSLKYGGLEDLADEDIIDDLAVQLAGDTLEESSLPILIHYLFERKTQTDETLQKVLRDWMEKGVKAPKGPHFFPPKELFKYREFLRPNRPDLQKSIAEEGIKEPLQLLFGKNGVIKIGEGNHRLKTAIQLGLSEVPVEFHFSNVVEKWQDVEDQYQMMKDKESLRKEQEKKRREAERKKLGLDKAEREERERRQREWEAMSPEEREKAEQEKQKNVDELMKLLFT